MMAKKSTILIMLSTYNGNKYIREQLDSLYSQKDVEIHILVRDDGSKDDTVEILKEYRQKYGKMTIYRDKNVGAAMSFHILMKYAYNDFSNYNYYAFSDQDDVWLPEKIALQVAEATKHPQEEPLLVYTDLKVVDENLNVQHESMIRTQSDHANTELIQELTENTVTGGVAMINHALADLWTGQEKHALLMHDWYLALLATAFGKLIYIDRPTELYRQHSSNVLGARTLRKRVKNWVRPHILFAKYWNLIESSQEQAKNLLDLPVSSQTKEIIENFVTIMDVPLKERLRRIRQYGYRKNRAFHTVVFTSLILTKFAYRGKK